MINPAVAQMTQFIAMAITTTTAPWDAVIVSVAMSMIEVGHADTINS